MSDKKPFVRVTSPKGVLGPFPCLAKEDNKYGGFKCSLILEDNEETRSFITKLEAVRDEYWEELSPAKQKKLNLQEVYEDELDDAGEETGRLIIHFKSKHAPTLFDSQKPKPQPVKGVDPWKGSVVKIACAVAGYDMPATKMAGLTKYMNAVQILELVAGGSDAASYGFDGEDGGFEASKDDAAPFDADDDSDDDDF